MILENCGVQWWIAYRAAFTVVLGGVGLSWLIVRACIGVRHMVEDWRES